jgi:uncharacterized protein
MSFSVSCARSGLEYAGSSLNALFAQRRNLASPTFFRMLRDILRFNRQAPRDLAEGRADLPMGDYLQLGGYGSRFIEHYIVPMGSAIWSTDPMRMLEFPAAGFIRFFEHHGLLNLFDRPQWRVISGGSHRYVQRLTAPFAQRIRLRTPVLSVRRQPDGVELYTRDAGREHFDAVVLACHSDQALRLLADPCPAEQSILSAIGYQHSEAVLHTDTALLPKHRRAWSAWNYHALSPNQPVCLTYHMNCLQTLNEPAQYLVTLNHGEAVRPGSVIDRITYEHPLFTSHAAAAQARYGEINGRRNTFYCGAYWGYGFHEDGVNSALAAVGRLFDDSPFPQRHL